MTITQEIEVWGTISTKVKVNPYSVIEETIRMFQKAFKIDNVDGIDANGNMYEHVEYATSHSWIDKEDRGKPTPQQADALNAVKLLKLLKSKIGEPF